MAQIYFARNLRLCRIRMGLRQEDMAEKLNIGRQTYCNYENGHREPSYDILADISDIFGISIDTLLRQLIP